MRRVALVYAAFIVIVSALASSRLSVKMARLVNQLPGDDITGHFLLMGGLACFAILGFASARVGGRPLGILGCVLIVVAFVTLDEIAQLAMPRRSFSIADLTASYAGIATFSLLGGWLHRRRASGADRTSGDRPG